MTGDELFIDVAEAARLLGISIDSYYRRYHAGDLPGRRSGRKIVVSRAALAEVVGTLEGMVPIGEAARLLGISEHHYRDQAKQGLVPTPRRIGRRVVVPLAEVRQIDGAA